MRKVVFVTGASKGIGKSIVKKFASLDYDIILHYFKSEEKALQLKEEISATYGVDVFLVQGDLSLEIEVQAIIASIYARYSHIDVLINNAALCLDNDYVDKTAQEFSTVLATNLIGPFLICKYVGEEMFKHKSGVIINIASTNGIDTNEVYSMDYDASKAGLISLTRNFSLALAPFVRVNAVAPGWTETESVLDMNPTYLKEEKEKIFLKRFANPDEIANVVFFLASEDASYVNGTVIRVDGGLK